MEQWERIVLNGVEYPYEISTKGRVRRIKTGRILKQIQGKYNHCRVNLCRNGVQKLFSVHRLVATMFIPNPYNLPEVDHIDRNPLNNCVENLRWVSHKENMENGGRRVKCVETGQEWDTITQASVETGINLKGIAHCCQGDRKTAGGFHWEYVE